MGYIKLPELTKIIKNQVLILNRIEDLQHRILPEWVDLRTACEYKGVNYDTVSDRPDLQPDRSKCAKVSGNRMWPRGVVIEWCKKNTVNYIPLDGEAVHKYIKEVYPLILKRKDMMIELGH